MFDTILNTKKTLFCCYINLTSQIQVAKISDEQDFEKVIFPYEKLLFHAPNDSKLRIFIENDGQTFLFDSIPCQELQIEKINWDYLKLS